jgi:hypothetical protein
MIGWRFALAAALAAAVIAGCIAYVSAPSPGIEASQRPPALPFNLPARDMETSRAIAPNPSAKERDVAAFERAADAILKRAAYAGASAERPISGRIPLPRKRPIPRQ